MSTFRGTSLDSFTKEVFSGIGMHISMIPEERRQQYTNMKSHTLTVSQLAQRSHLPVCGSQSSTYHADPISGAPKAVYTDLYPLKLDLTTDAEYVANLVNVNMWL